MQQTTIVDKNGNFYQGQWQNGAINGTGKMTFSNGDVYEGNWGDNKKNESGKMTYQDGTVYDGEWLEDDRHGTGRMTYSNGDVYEGDWENDKKDGKGRMRYFNGDVYEGDWNYDDITGMGIMTYSDGDVYKGNWLENERHGNGTMEFADGDVYEGEWKDDSISGKGKMTYLTRGEVYDGDWDDASITGNGKMTYSDGTIYEGGWVNYKRHGTGTMTDSNNNITSVDFYMGNQLPPDFYNVIKRSGTKIQEIVAKINQFSKNNSGSLLYLFHSLLKHIENVTQIPAEIEIPVDTVFYRTISIKKPDSELETHISGVNADIKTNAKTNESIKNSLGIGSEGTFCNENPLDNIVIDLPGSINNAVSILKTREAFKALNFNPLQHLFNEQLKSGQKGNRGLIKDCCMTGDMRNFLKNNNMGICLIDAADSMDLFKTTLPTFSYETNLIRLNELLPEQLRRDVNDMRMNVNDDFRKSVNEIRINDVKMDRVLPVYDSGTSCMYGTLGPEFFMPPDKFKIESVHSYTSFYVPGTPHLKHRTLSDQGIKLFPNINKYDIQPGKINGEDCHYIHPELAARSYIYNSMGISSSTVIPFLTDYAGDETILNSIDANFEGISKTALILFNMTKKNLPRFTRTIQSSNNSQKNKPAFKSNKIHNSKFQSKKIYMKGQKDQINQNQILMKKQVKQVNYGNKGGKKTYKKSKRRHNKTRRRSTRK